MSPTGASASGRSSPDGDARNVGHLTEGQSLPDVGNRRGADDGAPERPGRHPAKPTALPWSSWRAALARSLRRFKTDELSDRAAALTYYSVLAIFPAFVVLVALLGIFGQYPQTTNAVLKIVGQLGPKSAVDFLRQPLTGVVRNKGGAGALLGVGLLGALWSASGYVGAFMRASNRVYEVEEGRRFYVLRPLQVAVTIVMVLMTAVVALAVVASGSLAQAIGDQIGVGRTAITIWDYAKWPVLLVIVVTMFAILYYSAPNARLPGFRWITPGGLLALCLWLLASVGFAVYVANFGSYNQTYGALGAIIVLLVWLWITNLALLLGLEFNAELERARELAVGQAAEHQLQVEPRRRPKHRTRDTETTTGSARPPPAPVERARTP